MKRLSLLLFLLIGQVIHAQTPDKPSSAEIYAALQKLQVLGSVLYVAAHPDDENTRMISYYANAKHMYTTYLSMTRGDGGQNLIGPEIREQLGLIRTQELLQARATDGGHQLFTRANDFGYSKNPDETLNLWNEDQVLQDVVWAIRKTRPDIIINRFDHRSDRPNHGHHTSSAILSDRAFDLAGDPTVYPDQLRFVEVWKPKRLFFNTSWWFYGSREKFAEADKSNMLEIDVGVYYPVLGKSNNEIAATSRSMHKSQGFGSTGVRGSETEYIELIKGDPFEHNALDGITTDWSRIKGGAPIAAMLQKVETDFDVQNPAASVPALMQVYRAIKGIPNDGFWVPMKLRELKDIIYWCSGLYIEAVADDYSGAPGNSMPVYLEAVNRSDVGIKLINVRFDVDPIDTAIEINLEQNKRFNKEISLDIPSEIAYSTPYWLVKKGSLGMYNVKDQKLRGTPENEDPVSIMYDLIIDGEVLSYQSPVVYKRNDPVHGEVYRPFVITPPVYLNITEEVYVFGVPTPKVISVLLKANQDGLKGTVRMKVPDDWEINPATHEVSLGTKGEEALLQFELIPPAHASEDEISVVFIDAANPEAVYDLAATVIEHDHIPTQTILKPARAKVVKVDLAIAGEKIGYIEGAGDKIPEFLEQVGYDVTMLEDGDFQSSSLSQYDAIITGVRAYNTSDRIRFYQEALFKYVEEGGNLIVQYNTNRRLKTDQLAPYPIQLSRERVAVEDAEVRILAPEHPVMQSPNRITEADFDGWVQERGLYFANEWDDQFTAVLSSNDPGEPPRDGGLLVAPYGKGWYVYTGYSWFRELPAGVPGAFRIFTNMISLGKRKEP